MTLDILANVVAVVVNLAVGLRLLHKGRSGGERPELLLGLVLAFDGIEWLLWLFAAYTPALGTPLGDALGYVCRAGIAASVICLLAFTQGVFHPGNPLALAASALATAAMSVGWIASGVVGDWNGYRTDLVWVWLELGAQMFAYAWTLFESFVYYLKLRRRLAHGLADPILTNRLLLWSAYAGTMLASQFILAAAQHLAGISGSYPALFDAVMALFTLAACAAIWLAFFPPPFYRSWLASGARSASG